MLQLIPDPLFRLALRLAHALRKLWWGLRKPVLQGCRVLAFDPAGRVLLVRHSYGSPHWMLPGGGLNRGEDAVAAGSRELAEETGCQLRDARLLAIAEEPLWGATNRVHFVAGQALGTPRADGREITELRFCAPAELPDHLAGPVGALIAEWIKTTPAALPD